MSIYLVVPIALLIIVSVSVLLSILGKNKSNKFIKFIPSIIFGSSTFFVFIKMLFISQGYEPITDIIVIIFLSIASGVSLLVAFLMEILERKKKTI